MINQDEKELVTNFKFSEECENNRFYVKFENILAKVYNDEEDKFQLCDIQLFGTFLNVTIKNIETLKPLREYQVNRMEPFSVSILGEQSKGKNFISYGNNEGGFITVLDEKGCDFLLEYKKKVEDNFYFIIEEAKKYNKQTKRVEADSINYDIQNLSGIEFEEVCKKLLMNMGFEVRTTKKTGDGGIDLVVYNKQPLMGGIYIVQCKRYAGSVGEPIIRDLYGVVTAERVNKGILITTGEFTQSAKKFAENKPIELIDKRLLMDLLSKYNIRNIETCANNTEYNYQYILGDYKRFEVWKKSLDDNPENIDCRIALLGLLVSEIQAMELRTRERIVDENDNVSWGDDIDWNDERQKEFNHVIELYRYYSKPLYDVNVIKTLYKYSKFILYSIDASLFLVEGKFSKALNELFKIIKSKDIMQLEDNYENYSDKLIYFEAANNALCIFNILGLYGNAIKLMKLCKERLVKDKYYFPQLVYLRGKPFSNDDLLGWFHQYPIEISIDTSRNALLVANKCMVKNISSIISSERIECEVYRL